jgi:DNA-binding beta-propeller fold protein YncE
MKIDPETNEVVGTFDVGRAPVYMAVVDGRLWVANGGERSVRVIDEATGDEVTRIGFETGVHGLAAADGSVWVLDLHGPRVLDNLKGTTIWRFDPATASP